MNETPPSPDNNNDDELFGQLADLGIEDISRTLEYELHEITYAQETLVKQRHIVEKLKGKHPLFAEFLEPFALENEQELYDAVIELREWLATTRVSDEIRERAYLADAIYTHIWQMAEAILPMGDKKDVQIKIITDEDLSAELKTHLLDVLDELAPSGGLDRSDSTAIQAAIDGYQAEQERSEQVKQLRIRANELFATHEPELLGRYQIYPKDPVWVEIRTWSSTNLAFRIHYNDDNYTVFSFGSVRDMLTTLRINEDDFLTLVAKVENILRTESAL